MTIFTFNATKYFFIAYPQNKIAVRCQNGASMVNPCGVVVNVTPTEQKRIIDDLVSFEGYTLKNDSDYTYAELSALK